MPAIESNTPNRLLILSTEAPVYRSLIEKENLPLLRVSVATDLQTAEPYLGNCDIILGDPPLISRVVDKASVLKWVQSSWAGVDRLCQPGLRRDYVLTGAKGVFGPLMSEYMMAYILLFERQLLTMLENQRNRQWKPLPYRPAADITLGIVGLGSIGKHLAKTARHFGIRPIAMNRSGQSCDLVESVFTADDSGAFFAQCDYIILTLPDTPATHHMINRQTLAQMKPSAVLMNVGRGSIINEAHLVDALRDNVIAGAVLDVFEKEPLDKSSPLWDLPNVYLTPHMAATSFPSEIAAVFVQNYQRYVNKEPLNHVIDFNAGY